MVLCKLHYALTFSLYHRYLLGGVSYYSNRLIHDML